MELPERTACAPLPQSHLSSRRQKDCRSSSGAKAEPASGWTCERKGPQHNAATRLQRYMIEQATVQDMMKTNRLRQQITKESGQATRNIRFSTKDRIALIGWGDAAMQNKIDGGSTKSLHFTCSSVRALKGEEALMSVIRWRIGRINSVCRGATCAETRAMVDLEDEPLALRYQWSEMLGEHSCGEFSRSNGTTGTWCV